MQIKKLFLLLSVVIGMALAENANFVNDNLPRVILIGIDGFSTDCIKNVPTIDWLKANGSWTFKARTTIQAVSAPGWSSILCSLDPVETGIIDNDWVPEWKGGKPPIHAISGNTPFKCVFETIKSQNSNLLTNSIYDWSFINYLSAGIGFVDHDYFCDSDLFTDNYCDTKMLEVALDSIDKLNFNFMFTYFGNLDETGHTFGFCDQEYNEEMTKIDGYVQKIIDKLNEKGILNNTYIILTTDHGATSHTKHHGDPNDQNILIPWIVYGPGIKKGYEITDRVNNMDSAPMVVKLLGLNQDPTWNGRVVPNVFATKGMEI